MAVSKQKAFNDFCQIRKFKTDTGTENLDVMQISLKEQKGNAEYIRNQHKKIYA